jgi:hypothetical protein
LSRIGEYIKKLWPLLSFLREGKAAVVSQSMKISKNASHFKISIFKKEHFMLSTQAEQSNFFH